MKEIDLQTRVADYLRLQYPDAIFHSDFGSGIKLTIGQATKQKRLNGGQRAWPDMFIAEPIHRVRAISGTIGVQYAGLFIELKREGVRLKNTKGDWATTHIAEQAEMLNALREKGYKAEFAVGFERAKEIIDGYLRQE